jgi:hypothetical protein
MRPKAISVNRLRQSIIDQPSAVFLALVVMPAASWIDNGPGPRAFQASAQNTTTTDTTAPTAPGSLTANLDPFVQPSGALDLSWTASSDPDSPNLTYYVEAATVSISV